MMRKAWRLELLALVLSGTAWSPRLQAQTEYTEAGNPTNFEQYNLELINRARLDPTGEAARYGIDLNEGLSPGTISSTPKPPLAMNQILLSTSRAHSQDMDLNNYFAHNTQSTGATPFDRMTSAGYIWNTAGENIAMTTSKAGPSKALVDSFHQMFFVDSGISGRGHRVNILNANYREAGLGFGWGTSGTYLTEDFGRRSSPPQIFLAGVVYNDANANSFYDPGEGLGGVTLTPNQGSWFAKTASAGGYAFPLTGLTGSLTVTASGGGLSGSIVKTVTLTGSSLKLEFKASEANQPPTVSLTRPADGAFFPARANILLGANASDGGGSVTKVEFFQGTTLLGTDTNGADGWSLAWNSVPAGSYTLTAKATDNQGATTTSSPVNITVFTRGDFNADRMADILFRHPSSGNVVLWLMK